MKLFLQRDVTWLICQEHAKARDFEKTVRHCGRTAFFFRMKEE